MAYLAYEIFSKMLLNYNFKQLAILIYALVENKEPGLANRAFRIWVGSEVFENFLGRNGSNKILDIFLIFFKITNLLLLLFDNSKFNPRPDRLDPIASPALNNYK